MATTQLLRLLWLLFFLPFFSLAGRRHTNSPPRRRDVPPGSLPPVVLLPGNTCSQLDARLTEADVPPSPRCAGRMVVARWFRLWKNTTELEDPSVAPCVADQLRLVFDNAAGDYRDVPGVMTRVLDFGSTRGFLADEPANRSAAATLSHELHQQTHCQKILVYTRAETSAWDGSSRRWSEPGTATARPCSARRTTCGRRRRRRDSRAGRSHCSGGGSARSSSTRAGRTGTNRSSSCRTARGATSRSSSSTRARRRHVKHFVMASTGAGGFVLVLQSLVSSVRDASPMGRVRRSIASKFTSLPSPKVFDRDTPLVVTPNKNYTAHDMPEFLTAVSLPAYELVTLYKTRALPVAMNFRAPAVPTTCINGVDVPTMEKLVYWDGDFSGQAPEIVYGDGDGVVNSASILALDTVIGDDPRQEYYKSIKIAGTSHAGVVSDDAALECVVSEILREKFY